MAAAVKTAHQLKVTIDGFRPPVSAPAAGTQHRHAGEVAPGHPGSLRLVGTLTSTTARPMVSATGSTTG